jgi:hypothetical protein
MPLSIPNEPIRLICMFAACFPSGPHVSSARAATAHAQLEQPSEDGECAGNPHESEHGNANVSTDVQLCDAADDVTEDDEHDRRDDRGGGDEKGVEEHEDGDWEGPPARAYTERRYEHEYE